MGKGMGGVGRRPRSAWKAGTETPGRLGLQPNLHLVCSQPSEAVGASR